MDTTAAPSESAEPTETTTSPEPDEPTAPPADEVSVRIAASPEHIWDMIADVTRMGEWSPECFRCRWVGSPKEPVAGARFVGFNRAGVRIWPTRNEVLEAERGRTFAWRTVDNGNIWSYRLVADGDTTQVTESRQLPARRPWFPKLLLMLFFGGLDHHNEHMRQGMQETLQRLKAVAEAGNDSQP